MFTTDGPHHDRLRRLVSRAFTPRAVKQHEDFIRGVCEELVAGLRSHPDAVEFVREFVESGKPVAAICHGPWSLLEAGVLKGRRITSFPSLRTDLRNAGAEVVDEEVVVDANIITSRNPDDLPAFCETVVREVSAVHAS
jgi:putative intracellular protease/amidase